jgi:hypothetical protein
MNLTELCEIMNMITPAYIAAARRNLNMHSGLRLQIGAPHSDSVPDMLTGEIHINFEKARVQWCCLQRIQGRYVRLAGMHSWPIAVATTSQDISRIVSANTPSIGQQENGAPEIPPDVCACVAQCLTDCDLLRTCASLNAASRQVQFAHSLRFTGYSYGSRFRGNLRASISLLRGICEIFESTGTIIRRRRTCGEEWSMDLAQDTSSK